MNKSIQVDNILLILLYLEYVCTLTSVKPFLDFIKNKITLLIIRLRLSVIFLHRKSKFPHTLCREKLTVNCIVPKPALLHGGSLNAH